MPATKQSKFDEYQEYLASLPPNQRDSARGMLLALVIDHVPQQAFARAMHVTKANHRDKSGDA